MARAESNRPRQAGSRRMCDGQGVPLAVSLTGASRNDSQAALAERTFAGLNQFRRLRVRYDKRANLHEAFLSLGAR
jgi:hypothetical protein